MRNESSIKLNMLASIQCFIGRELQLLYDAARSGDFTLTEELSHAIINADKFTMSLRAMSELAERGAPKHFDKAEADLLDQLERSHEFIRQRNVVPFSQKSIDESISYLEDPKEGA